MAPYIEFMKFSFTLIFLIGMVAMRCVLAAELTASDREKLEATARLTQSQCIHYMVNDPSLYAQCVRNLRKKQGSNTLTGLAVDYFGYVGAMSYMRVKTIGADTIAAEFLKNFRLEQKKLHISDGDLCSTVPGNCVVRIAQTLAMEKEPPKTMVKRVVCAGGSCRFIEQLPEKK